MAARSKLFEGGRVIRVVLFTEIILEILFGRLRSIVALVKDAKIGDLYQISNDAATHPVFHPQYHDQPDNYWHVGWLRVPPSTFLRADELYKGAYIIYVGSLTIYDRKFHTFRTFKGKEVYLFRGTAFRYLEEIN
jgi:hypothetical protein